MSNSISALLLITTSLIGCTQTAAVETYGFPISDASRAQLAVELPRIRASLANDCTPAEIDLVVKGITLFAVATDMENLDLSPAEQQHIGDELSQRTESNSLESQLSATCYDAAYQFAAA